MRGRDLGGLEEPPHEEIVDSAKIFDEKITLHLGDDTVNEYWIGANDQNVICINEDEDGEGTMTVDEE